MKRLVSTFSLMSLATFSSLFFYESLVQAQDRVCITTDSGATVCGKPNVAPPKKTTVKKMKAIDAAYNITFILDGCKRVDSSVQCSLSMKNQGQEVQFSMLHDTSKIVDSAGRSYPGYEAIYAGVNSSGGIWSGEIRMFPGIDYPVSMRFNNVPEEITKIPILIIATRRGGNGASFAMQFRNVGISN
jgi:hypothetical protein